MLIDVTLRKVDLNKGQHEWIQRRIQFALGRFMSHISHVSAIFSDTNGTRGGVDKKCRLRVSLIPHGEVVVDDVETSVEAAAANVTERAARSVARFVGRLHDSRTAAGAEFPAV